MKHLRWASWILADGSQIRSLSGRSAQLGDGYSRNPPDRDRLIEQRSKDLEGRTGQLRGFSLDEFLGDYEAEGEQFPWSVGDDALPDKAARPAPERTPGAGCSEPEFARSPAAGESSTAGGAKSVETGGKDGKSQQTKDKAGALARVLSEVMSAAGLPPPTKVVCVTDYGGGALAHSNASKVLAHLARLLPGHRVSMVTSPGPFEDTLGNRSHYDGGKGGLKEARLILETKKDTLTSVVTLARSVLLHQPDVVVGEGQGGVIALAYAKPLQLEVALQARNVQRDEVQSIAESWGRIKACISLYPVLSQNKVGCDLLKKCNPEMFDQEFPVEGLPVYGVITDSDRHSDQQRSLFRSAGVEKVRDLSFVDWQMLLGRPPREMWSHTGKCQCGRRTFLFGQCPRCIRDEALDRLSKAQEEHLEDDTELGSGVAYSLASTSSTTSLFVSDAMVKELSLAAQDAKGGVKTLLHGTVSVTNLARKGCIRN